MYKFYDTCSLLLKATDLFDEEEHFAISSITLKELEYIKTANNKDEDVKFAARCLISLLDKYPTAYDVVIFTEKMLAPIVEKDLSIDNDMKILASAIWYDKYQHPDETIFVSNDCCLRQIANLFFGNDSIESVREDKIDSYLGYKEIYMSSDDMTAFYSNPSKNTYDLLINEYSLIYDSETNELVDQLKWNGESYEHLNYSNFNSRWLGNIKPMKGDIYQALLADSFLNNRITMVKGPAGSGKTFLSLAYLFSQLERGRIDKIIVFCNTIATKNSARLGFYPGTRDEKLLDSQIGNLLSSKLGGRIAVEDLIERGHLVLLPMSDIRGYDTSGMNAGIYISEAQNLDITLMKLALQRIGEDCICIIDGDCKTQVDNVDFAGSNNGMRRVSKVFRGHDIYGEVALQQIHRSKIAQLAESM